MVRYFFAYKDVRGNEFLCQIRELGYTGVPQQIKGTAVLTMPRIESIYTVLRGQGMTLFLEANLNITLEDLYADNIQAFPVTLQRNGQVIFRGFIDPNGLYEDLVDDAWIVSLDCIDGLGLLEDIAYLDPAGNPFIGRLRDLEVINNCLRRGGVTTQAGAPLLVQTSVNTRYFGLDRAQDPLFNTFTNQARFYRDDGSTVMSCREVLESTLRKYGAFIYYSDDIWRIHTFYEVAAAARNHYTYRGLQLLNISFRESLKTQIGSTATYTHRWVNRNQRKEIVPPAGAVKINYSYGFVNTIFQNPLFANTFINGNGQIIGWEFNADAVRFTPEELGVYYDTGSDFEVMLEPLTTETVSEGDVLDLKMGYTMQAVLNVSRIVRFEVRFRITVTTPGGAVHFYTAAGWQTSSGTFNTNYNLGGLNALELQELEREIEAVPATGELAIQLLRIRTIDATSAQDFSREVQISEFAISVSTDETIEGETHTYQVANGGFRAEEVIEVSVGDVPSDIYIGALYQADGSTNTALWGTAFLPNDVAPSQALLDVLCEQIALYRRDPSCIIKGDVFGNFTIDSVFEFDLVAGRDFMLTYYEYDTVNNVVSAEWMELKRGSSFGLTYSFELDFGNAGKPTVTGV